jgi:glyoxylase-like metal-dependent hydrolase (beta-lactamase superfamily II)
MPLPIAETWFRHETLSDDVTLIWEHHVSPDVFCNIWFLRGRDRNLLFDSGLGVRSLRSELAFLDDKPVVCVASHSHFDHRGGHQEFVECLGHAAEAEIMAEPTRTNTLLADYVEPHHFSALPHEGFDPMSFTLAPAPLSGHLDEGDVIDLGDRVLRVLHLPGHSPGSIALYEEAAGLLLSGDAIYDGQLFDHLFHSDTDAYLDSMERLRHLPVSVVHPGHYSSFGGARMVEIADEYIAGRRRPGCPNETRAAGPD